VLLSFPIRFFVLSPADFRAIPVRIED
jgi:hypothetical protein